ncbi:MAG: response regulator [Proteobacteria bacterium]|nr:response regulator [Pseudomonadota bacterium]
MGETDEFKAELEQERKAKEALKELLETRTEELRSAVAAAQTANNARERFLASLNHEIRSPLNGMLEMTELLVDTELSSEQANYLNTIKTSGHTVVSFIDDIIDFSKIETETPQLDLIDFKLRHCIDEAIRGLAFRASQKGLKLAYEVETDVPDQVIGDPFRLRQILINLVRNSIRYTEEGEIVVSVGLDSKGTDSTTLHFEVSDTGIGIDEKQRNKISELFDRDFESTPKRLGYDDSGIGLALSSRLVHIMDGRIWIDSRIGMGSIFHFTTDLKWRPETTEETVPHTNVDIEDLQVLVIDDNSTNRYILENILFNWGTRPTGAENRDATLQILEEARQQGRTFEIVLVNDNVPKMDGFNVSQWLKENYHDVVTKIILLSSMGQRGDAVKCEKIGISAYLLKPLKPSELLSGIYAVVSQEESSKLITRHTIRENRENPEGFSS